MITYTHPKFGTLRVEARNHLAWFPVEDICDIVNIINPTTSWHYVDIDDIGVIYDSDNNRVIPAINESGIASAFCDPSTREFRSWVFYKVLPDFTR